MDVTPPIHVGIISDHGIELQPSQKSGLNKALREVHSSHSRRVVLHHGCNAEADDIAHRFACGAGWRIEGHPTYVAAGVVPRQPAAMRDQLKVLHPARRHDDRDAAIIWASDVIVAVESGWGRSSALLSQATNAGWPVTYIESAKLHVIPAQDQPPAVVSWPTHNWLVDSWR